MLESKKVEAEFHKTYFNTLIKAVLIGFCFSFFMLLFFQTTSAFFTKETITNKQIPIGNVVITASTLNNPYTFTNEYTSVPVNVVNLSNTHVVVRAYLNVHWLDGYPLGNVSAILSNSNWTTANDGFFYYNQVLTPFNTGSYQASFLDGLEIVDETGEKQDKNFIVTVFFEAAQYANNGYQNLWLNAPQSWLNLVKGEE